MCEDRDMIVKGAENVFVTSKARMVSVFERLLQDCME